MSEYGFQSFPELKTVEAYTEPEDRKNIETEVMLAHQKHPRGNQLIREYMLRDFEEPKDFESFLYVSQVLQAEGMRIGTEHFRRIMPRNMGALYWQVNDCWPVASWSGTDYFGRWKAMHYYAKRFFEPLFVSPLEEEGNLNFYVVSDFPETKDTVLQVRAMDLDGNVHYKRAFQIRAEGLKGKSYLSIPTETLLNGLPKGNVVVEAQLADISADGCRLALPGLEDTGIGVLDQNWQLAIHLPDTTDPLKVLVTTRHSRFLSRSKLWYVGCRFENNDGQSQQLIDRFVTQMQRLERQREAMFD